QLVDDDRLGFAFEQKRAGFAFEKIFEAGADFGGNEDPGAQKFIQTVEARNRVYRVAGDAVLVMIAGADVAQKNLAGVDRDAGGQSEAGERLIKTRDRVGESQCRRAGLAADARVRPRGLPQSENRIALELDHQAAVLADRLEGGLEIAMHEIAQLARGHFLRQRRVAGGVGEQANAVDGLAAAPDVDDILRELIDHIAGNVVAERVADVLALFVDRKVVEQHRPDQTEGRLQERDHHRVPDGLRGELVFGQAQVESVQSDG